MFKTITKHNGNDTLVLINETEGTVDEALTKYL